MLENVVLKCFKEVWNWFYNVEFFWGCFVRVSWVREEYWDILSGVWCWGICFCEEGFWYRIERGIIW